MPKPVRDQVERRIPALRDHRQRVDELRVCGRCAHYGPHEWLPNTGKCAYQGRAVAKDAIECEGYEERE